MAILKVEPSAINSGGDFALGSITTTGNVNVGGMLVVDNNILPTVANTIDIGSSAMRFGKLYLAGNTIDLGGTLISTDATGVLTFTTESGNVAITANTIGFLSTVANTSSTGGDIAFDGNLNAYAVYTDRYFYANGAPFAGGGGGAGSTGATGPTGPTGYVGSRGIQGVQGTTGATGPAGTNGYTGSRGDTGLGFNIAKSYASVSALTADTAPSGIVSGQFAIIETGDTNNAENSRLYLWNGSAYSYVSDLSGAQGIIGPTGAVGYTGSIGATGTNGYTGSAGVAGSGYINLFMIGPVSPPFTGTARFYPPNNVTVNTVYANLSSAPTSGNLNFVIKKNGVSVGTTFVLSSALMTPVSVNFSLTTTDYLTLDVTGSTASDLSVKLKYI